MERSVGIITVLVPRVGYQRAADIAKRALAQDKSVLEIVVAEKIMKEEEAKTILNPEKMIKFE